MYRVVLACVFLEIIIVGSRGGVQIETTNLDLLLSHPRLQPLHPTPLDDDRSVF